MSERIELTTKMVIDGRPYTIRLISHPTIEDVLVTEAKIAAFEIENGPGEERRVERPIRDYLIRLGVER